MASTGIDTNGEEAATRVLADYYRAVSTLEVQAVLPFFHEPSLFIGPQGLFAASTTALVEGVFTPAMEGLRAKGFARSELNVPDRQIAKRDNGVGYWRCTAL